MALTSYAGLKDPMNLGHFLFHSPPLVRGVEWWLVLVLGVGTLLIKVGGGVVPVFAGLSLTSPILARILEILQHYKRR